MLRAPAFAIALFLAASFGPARADDPPLEFPPPITCTAPADDTGLADAEKTSWNDCEKWVWSCIRQGLEANLFSKQCLTPRQADTTAVRKKFKLVPFVDPDLYKTSNGLSDHFLIKILTKDDYVKQIPPIGIRVFGAHFAGPVNLENVTTKINLVLDASMARQGLRLTNFKSEKNLALDGSNIRGPIFLMRARIDGSVFMERSVIDSIDLNDSRIGASFEGTGSVFNGELRLNRALIEGKVIVTKARLTTLMAWNAHIGSSLEMRLADVRVGIDLTGSTVDGDVRMQEVTFGRRAGPSRRCDWDPADQSDHILNALKLLLPPQMFETAWKETTELRNVKNGMAEANPCEITDPTEQPGVRENALLREMKIKGSLCLIDVTGEIKGPVAPGEVPMSIKTISIDSTEAKSTIVGWKPSDSLTEWRAVNFKTEYMLINLHSQPKAHYVDNLDVRVITLLRTSHPLSSVVSQKISDEHLVKKDCDVTPDTDNTDAAGDRDAQNRIIQFFSTDKSGSAQPFSTVVNSLETSGVNTVHMRKALSKLKYRNICTTSQLTKEWEDLPWASVPERLKKVSPRETAKFAVDGVCQGLRFTYANLVSYGHEPHKLVYFALVLVLLFWLLLKLDRPIHQGVVADIGGTPTNSHFNLAYAIDNFIPIAMYRFDRERADVLPNRRWLRAYRIVHRAIGTLCLIYLLLVAYKVFK